MDSQLGMFLATQSVRSAFDEVRPDAPAVPEVERAPRTRAALHEARAALAGLLLRASQAVAPPARTPSGCVPAR
ncbi:hypothetical protein [Pseudonocardia sp. TRM90224]|uniref:hypothetical protein n=1 Tax=Pseudonocardia sp. TRM90224 TaxID=2812678 RepID=UPI001E4F454F|nr:hypothetical protein [Pseudonocardia sp. TRM90224]